MVDPEVKRAAVREGEMAHRIRSHDWASTPLGPIGQWPQALHTAVELMLDSAQPAYVAWGRDLVSLYNDSFIPIAGSKHPASLGQPYRVMWAEIWDEYRPLVEDVMAGQPRHFIDRPARLAGRAGRPMSWFTFSWTPLRDAAGEVAGFYCAAHETTDRVLAERSVRHSYHTLLDAIDDGFCVIEMVFDGDGRPVDYRFLEANAAFGDQTGLHDVVGHGARELVPDLEPFWFETYGRIARSGQGERFEHYAEPLKRWFDVFASRVGEAGDDRVAILFKDVTERKRADATLRGSEERHAFLLALSDALRAEATADAMAERALTMLSSRLRLDRCYISRYRLDDDRADIPHQVGNARIPPMPASIRLSDFPEAFRIAFDRTLVIPDTAIHAPLSEIDRRSIAALGLASLVAATLRKGAGTPLWVLVAVCAEPRQWTAEEISLIEDVAERTWAAIERARAEASLGESEERLRRAAEIAQFALWDWNLRTDEVTWSDEHYRMQGYRIGEVAPSYASWAARVHPDDLPGTEAAIAAARGSRGEFVHEFRSVHPDGSTHWLLARGRFFYDEAGEPLRMVGAMLDVTERREWEERQKVLVAELQHRTFNLMGVVRSTADAALRRSADLDEFKARFNDRIAVLARVQRLLSKLKEEQRVTFDELVRGELESVGAFDTPGRVTLDGPDGVALRSSGVQTFALALHELATNAVKYGALSQPGARLGVRWCVHADDAGAPWLHVEWRESGVAMPACAQPQGTGQGRDLIEKALPYQLRAKTEYRMTADGVKCSIALPVSRHRMVETGAASLEEWRG